jgi:hypothetical protein
MFQGESPYRERRTSAPGAAMPTRRTVDPLAWRGDTIDNPFRWNVPFPGDARTLLDRAAALPELRVEFAMRAGEMLFVNNRQLLHNRTAFADFADPPRKRHLVRLWLWRA